jgi:hypothetical protein
LGQRSRSRIGTNTARPRFSPQRRAVLSGRSHLEANTLLDAAGLATE